MGVRLDTAVTDLPPKHSAGRQRLLSQCRVSRYTMKTVKVKYLGGKPSLGTPTAAIRSQQAAVSQVLLDVRSDKVAIPKLQRPFLWETPQVRDLTDFLQHGYSGSTIYFPRVANSTALPVEVVLPCSLLAVRGPSSCMNLLGTFWAQNGHRGDRDGHSTFRPSEHIGPIDGRHIRCRSALQE